MQIGKTVFTRTKFDGLDGHTTVGFTAEGDEFSLKANRVGVQVRGELILETEEELEEFAKLFSLAWQEHRRLKPKLLTTLSGH